MLPQMKHEMKSARQPTLYIYEYFNIFCITPNPDSLVKNVLAKFMNCIIKALNDSVKLPRIILFIPDLDIIRYICRTVTVLDADLSDLHLFVEGALNWIINQVAWAIDAAKDNLQRRKPGAILSYEPKMVWVKMMDRIGTGSRSKSLALRNIFNTTLGDKLSGRTGHFIIDIDQAMDDASFFDADNHLNEYGRHHFWLALDKIIGKI